MEKKDTQERARDLVSTSVEDMNSSLNFYQFDEPTDVEIIMLALKIVTRRGEKTKVKILERKIKKMKKESDEKNILRFKLNSEFEMVHDGKT